MSQLIRNYRDLLVWQRGMDLIDKTDDIVRRFSSSDRFWLGSQMLRAALSIPSNIAEGHDADYRPLCIRRLLTRRARARNWKLNYLWSNAAAAAIRLTQRWLSNSPTKSVACSTH